MGPGPCMHLTQSKQNIRKIRNILYNNTDISSVLIKVITDYLKPDP